MDAILRLFNGVLISKKKQAELDKKTLSKCIKNGFILSPEIPSNFSEEKLGKLINKIIQVLGLSGKKLNASFHKSWQKVRDASIEQLVVEQIIHYFTTYGLESVGLYSEDMVYIPVEELHVPKVDIDEIKLTVIKAYTEEELRHKLVDLLGSGVALSQETVNDVLSVCKLVDFQQQDMEKVKNKEVRAALYDHFGFVPSSNIEFIRFLIYKATGKTLLIKNKETIEEIKKSKFNASDLLRQYQKDYGLPNLAKTFYRFKPLLLAFKNRNTKEIINRIRRLAVQYHEPLPEDYINSITAKLKNGSIDEGELAQKLTEVNTFRKIKLAYALQYRCQSVDSILYRIRNGKGYATDFQFPFGCKRLVSAQHIVESSIIDDCKARLKGRKIYIPDNIVYALPSTEKQFVDKIPSGSYISISKDAIVGIHWDNVDGERIDLDLSLLGCGKKFGWDGLYRGFGGEGKADILFSGDMTDAPKPHGASELFYVNKIDPSFVVLNYFNYSKDVEVPCQLFVASQKVTNVTKNYMVDPNHIIAKSVLKINRKQKILGLLTQQDGATRFYFIGTDVGATITSYGNQYMEHARNYLYTFYQNAISLNVILELAGVKFVSEPACEINLSPEKLEKDTMINLLCK
jgi:hypothetical protein